MNLSLKCELTHTTLLLDTLALMLEEKSSRHKPHSEKEGNNTLTHTTSIFPKLHEMTV